MSDRSLTRRDRHVHSVGAVWRGVTTDFATVRPSYIIGFLVTSTVFEMDNYIVHFEPVTHELQVSLQLLTPDSPPIVDEPRNSCGLILSILSVYRWTH